MSKTADWAMPLMAGVAVFTSSMYVLNVLNRDSDAEARTRHEFDDAMGYHTFTNEDGRRCTFAWRHSAGGLDCEESNEQSDH